jgi:hypothetical protein
MFVCLECGRRFRTARAAERAADNGCPKCGGVDIDLDVSRASLLPCRKDGQEQVEPDMRSMRQGPDGPDRAA